MKTHILSLPGRFAMAHAHVQHLDQQQGGFAQQQACRGLLARMRATTSCRRHLGCSKELCCSSDFELKLPLS